MDIRTQARGHAYVLSVLKGQQADPFCSSCNSFAKTLTAAREGLGTFERQNADALGGLTGDLARLRADTASGYASLRAPEHPVGQKKAGNCLLPEGVCFLNSSFALLQKI